MKKMKFVLAGLLLASFAVGQLAAQNVEAIRKALLNPKSEKVLVVSHRGNWRSNAPENSLAAIDSAIQMKVDIVELDVWKTKDGVPVLMHDERVDRTTNGKGRISDMTLAEIKALRLKDKNGNITEHTVPTLEEALLRAKGKIMMNLDKASDYFDEVFALLEKTGTRDMIIMKGWKPAADVKKEFRKYLDKVIYMPIINMEDPEPVERVKAFLKELHPVMFELCYSNPESIYPKKMVKLLKGKSTIWYNSLWASLNGGHEDDKAVNDLDGNYGYLIDTLHARVIQTDRPALLLNYLRSRGMHD